MQELHNRVAAVTGAGSGIGRALAGRFAAEGMRVALADIEETALTETRDLLLGAGVDKDAVTMRVTDVGDEDAVRAFADQAYYAFGAVHVLCNNAGVFSGGQLWSRPAKDFEWVFRVNLWGVLHGIRAFVPRMIEQDTEGHVVNTCSTAGLAVAPFSGPYTVAKFAAYAATEALAHEFAISGLKLRATALCPGGVTTGIHRSGRNRPPELRTESTPDQHFIEQIITDAVTHGIPPEDVAELVVDAIRAERFLVLTHEAYAPVLRERAESLMAGRLPRVPDFAVGG